MAHRRREGGREGGKVEERRKELENDPGLRFPLFGDAGEIQCRETCLPFPATPDNLNAAPQPTRTDVSAANDDCQLDEAHLGPCLNSSDL